MWQDTLFVLPGSTCLCYAPTIKPWWEVAFVNTNCRRLCSSYRQWCALIATVQYFNSGNWPLAASRAGCWWRRVLWQLWDCVHKSRRFRRTNCLDSWSVVHYYASPDSIVGFLLWICCATTLFTTYPCMEFFYFTESVFSVVCLSSGT